MPDESKKSSGAIRAFIVQALGIGGAQALLAFAAPLLTHVYAPNQFASFGVLVSSSSLLIVLLLLQLDRAIVMAAEEKSAQDLGKLCFGMGVFGAVATGLAGFMAHEFLPGLDLWLWAIFLPLTIFALTVQRLATQFALRRSLFPRLAMARWVQAVATIAVSFAMAPIAPLYGLVIGYAFGAFALAVCLAPALGNGGEPSWIGRGGRRELAVLRQFWRFPVYSTPAGLLGTFKDQAPLLLSSLAFGAVTTGFVALSMRIVGAPISILGSSLSEVFTRDISARLRGEGESSLIPRQFWLATLFLLALGLAMILAFALVGEWVLDRLTGPEWDGLAQIMGPLVVFNAAMMIVLPAASLIDVAQRQHRHIFAQLAMIALTGAAFFIGRERASPELSLWLTAGGAFMVYGVLWWTSLPLLASLRRGEGLERLGGSARTFPNA